MQEKLSAQKGPAVVACVHADCCYFHCMSGAVDAIYQNGLLQLLAPLPLPEHTRVRVAVELVSDDPERSEWLAQSQSQLETVWDNDADDVFNELLAS